MKGIVARNPANPSAPAAYLLIANAYEHQNRPDDAVAAYVELRTKYQSSPAAAEGTFAMAEFVLRSKRADREQGAQLLFSEISTSYPDSAWAPRALARKAALEERAKQRVVDPQLNTSVPAALISYRTLVERYPRAEAAEASLAKLADMYEDLKRYELAARSLDDLAERFPNNSRDAAWRAAELYDRKMKDSHPPPRPNPPDPPPLFSPKRGAKPTPPLAPPQTPPPRNAPPPGTPPPRRPPSPPPPNPQLRGPPRGGGMKPMFKGLIAATLLAATGMTVHGSSHREALAILNEPCADNTDTYAWVSNRSHDKLYLIMDFNPLHEPGQGNQGLRACNGYRYEFHIGKGASLEGRSGLPRRVQEQAHARSPASPGSSGRRQRAALAAHRRHRDHEGHAH